MKHLRFIHALAGLLVLALILAEVIGVIQVINASPSFDSPAILVLLAAALSNLCISGYTSNHHKARCILQAFSSIVMLTAFAPALWFAMNTNSTIAGHSSGLIAIALLIFSSVLFFFANMGRPSPEPEYYDYDDSHRETGTVKWFNVTKGFGFITRDSGDDVFVHYRAIRGEGHRTLTEGQRVEFEVIDKDKGLQAEDVIAAPKGR